MYSLILMMALPADTPAPAATAPVVVEYAGCNGSSPGLLQRLFHHADHGCNGGSEEKHHLFHHSDYGCCGGKAGTIITSAPPPAVTPAKPLPPGEAVPAPKDKKQSAASPGRLLLSVPADARVFVDEEPTRSSSAQRVFVTPALESGAGYTYTLRAELVRDGKVHNDVQVVTVTAGESVTVSFPNLTASDGSGSTAAAGE
jgi:uncharacterized protein (TIGR03000 family)